MADPDPRLLPGPSARALWRGCFATLFGALGICAGTLPVAYSVQVSGHWSVAFGIAVLILVGAVVVVAAALLPPLALTARRVQQRELDCGYTTLMPEFDHVDGISPTTKQIVRPAVEKLVYPDSQGQITTGASLGPLDTGRTPIQILLGRRVAVATEIASVLVLVGCATGFLLFVEPLAHPSQALVIPLLCLAIVAFSVAITVATVVAAFVPTWYYTARLNALAAGSAFAVGVSNGDVVEELVGHDAPKLSGSMFRARSYLVLSDDRLVLYSRSGSALVPYLDVPKSRTVSARVGSSMLGTGGSSTPAPVLTFSKDNGSQLTVTFSLIGPDYRSGRLRFEKDSQKVVDWAEGFASEPS